MFNSDNRWFHLYIPFDAETVLMAVLWLCLLIVVFHFFRKRTKLIQNFGVTTLLLLLGLVLVRLFMPIQLNYSKDIPSGGFPLSSATPSCLSFPAFRWASPRCTWFWRCGWRGL